MTFRDAGHIPGQTEGQESGRLDYELLHSDMEKR